jgi:hypothetical protein
MPSPWLFSWLLAWLNYRKTFLLRSLLFVPWCSPPFIMASVFCRILSLQKQTRDVLKQAMFIVG